MEAEIYSKIAKRFSIEYLRRANSNGHISDCNFMDVGNNLVSGLNSCAQLISLNSNNNGRKEELEKRFRKNIRIIKNYFSLLDNFPEFNESELNICKGHYGKINDFVYGDDIAKEEREKLGNLTIQQHYVVLSKRVLEHSLEN